MQSWDPYWKKWLDERAKRVVTDQTEMNVMTDERDGRQPEAPMALNVNSTAAARSLDESDSEEEVQQEPWYQQEEFQQEPKVSDLDEEEALKQSFGEQGIEFTHNQRHVCPFNKSFLPRWRAKNDDDGWEATKGPRKIAASLVEEEGCTGKARGFTNRSALLDHLKAVHTDKLVKHVKEAMVGALHARK